jgi:hypothetical protein
MLSAALAKDGSTVDLFDLLIEFVNISPPIYMLIKHRARERHPHPFPPSEHNKPTKKKTRKRWKNFRFDAG